MTRLITGLSEDIEPNCKKIILMEMEIKNLQFPVETEVHEDTVSFGGLIWSSHHFIFV